MSGSLGRQCGIEVISRQSKGPELCPHHILLGFDCGCFVGEKVWTPWSSALCSQGREGDTGAGAGKSGQ